MLVIRMQRTGRKGLAQYRVVVQDSRQTPTSGKNVASLGHYNPHTKENSVDLEKAKVFMNNGAQPSDRVAHFLNNNGVKLPKWVTVSGKKTTGIKNSDKLRKNRPAEEIVEVADEVTEIEVTDDTETTVDETVATVAEPTEETKSETTEEPAPESEKVEEAEKEVSPEEKPAKK